MAWAWGLLSRARKIVVFPEAVSGVLSSGLAPEWVSRSSVAVMRAVSEVVGIAPLRASSPSGVRPE